MAHRNYVLVLAVAAVAVFVGSVAAFQQSAFSHSFWGKPWPQCGKLGEIAIAILSLKVVAKFLNRHCNIKLLKFPSM